MSVSNSLLSPVSTPDLTASTPAAAATGTGADKLANEQTFLQLLVAQLKNQDPANPADGTQFVTQLAQFSSLEQLLAMRQDTDKLLANQNAALASAQPASTAVPPAN